MATPWCTPDKGENGAVIGEIYFGPHSSNLSSGDQRELDKLTQVLATFYGEIHDFHKPSLLILGDRDVAEPPSVAQNRANVVKTYVTSKLPPNAKLVVKIEAVAKGGASLPGMTAPPPAGRVVKIINKGKKITPMAEPLKRAGSIAEALEVAAKALQENPPANDNQAKRIRYWVVGQGKTSIVNGRDGYLSGSNPGLVQQMNPSTGELSDAQFEKNLNRIGPELMSVCARSNLLRLCRDELIRIDSAIEAGIDNIIRKKGIESSTIGSRGLEQLGQFVIQRSQDPSSFYHAYLGGVPHRAETDTAMGIWRVTASGGGKTWHYEYELRPGGGAKWTDLNNRRTSLGKWVMEAEQVRFYWDNSENTEVWKPLPLNPDGQNGLWVWKDGSRYQLHAKRTKKIF